MIRFPVSEWPAFAAGWLILLTAHFTNCNALLLKCPLYQMHLQKIVGFRPPLEYIGERNLIYAPPDDSRYHSGNRSTRNDDLAVFNGARSDIIGPADTVSTICWRLCIEDTACIAYVHLLDTNECYGYSYFQRTARYRAIANDMPLVADAEAIFYEKTCLRVPETCKSRLWTLTKIPGSSLVFQGKKTVPVLVTRRECAEKCLFEREFECLSASFAPSFRNNRERFSEQWPQKHIVLGRCILSDKDKMIQPDAFRAAPYDEEYIENQCYARPMENDHCSYELYANSSFIYAEAKYVGLTQKECQAYCTLEKRFYCQGVSFHYEHTLVRSECALHSEDIISMGPRSLKQRPNSVYMRRVKCLDVQVLCTHTEMAIKFVPKDWFHGKMYANMHSKDCLALGNGTKSTLLRLAIGSEAKENRCGILRAYEVTKTYRRIFISALIVIQNNPNVQTQGDRLIKVGCIMSNSSALAEEAGNDPDTDEGEFVPNAVALESSLEFTRTALPNEGSVLFNTSEPHLLPKTTLQIVDQTHRHETADVQIGQNLELQIVAEYNEALAQPQKPLLQHASLPNFRATSLVAKTLDNLNYVLLIDERGCPTDVTVFPALERKREAGKNMLRARFHAFKFAGTSLVNFDVKIHFCTAQPCPEENCHPYGSIAALKETDTLRRRRRQLPAEQEEQHVLKVQNPVYISTVMDVAGSNATHTWNDTHLSEVLPLNYNLHVRGPDSANANSFIYGERGVLLIAGIDDRLHLDNVCLNQSLLIALLIFWLIFQVALLFGCCYVIQKYKRLAVYDDERRKIHETLEYLESRRQVHWADQGGYTL